jgi:hypothetical protein
MAGKKILKKGTRAVVPDKPAEPPAPTPKKRTRRPPAPTVEPTRSSLPLDLPGPPPLKSGEGRLEMSVHLPEYSLTLTRAEFMWVWRMVESKALTHYQHPSLSQMMPEQVDVAISSAGAFRRAYSRKTEEIKQPLGGGARKVVKRSR